jgi:hypothetical protein
MPEEIWMDGTYDDLYKVTETRGFEASAVQIANVREKPNIDWALSGDAEMQLKKDVGSAWEFSGMKLDDGGSPINITFVFGYDFTRPGPPQSTNAYMKDNRTLNFSQYDDCMTGKELELFALTDCKTVSNPDMEWMHINIIQAYNPKLALG